MYPNSEAREKIEETFYNNLKEPFLKYEKIRKSGKYNMIMDAKTVINKIGCSLSIYMDIIDNYTELKKRFIN